jgi:hypothetical protein
VQKPTVPDSIQAPAGEELILMARATGFQIYVCRPDADGKPVWTLKAPEADLFDEHGKPFAHSQKSVTEKTMSQIGNRPSPKKSESIMF